MRFQAIGEAQEDFNEMAQQERLDVPTCDFQEVVWLWFALFLLCLGFAWFCFGCLCLFLFWLVLLDFVYGRFCFLFCLCLRE